MDGRDDYNSNSNNNRNFKSSFKSFSRVCYNDPQNPGKMICKESENNNGNKNMREFISDLENKEIMNMNMNNRRNNMNNNLNSHNDYYSRTKIPEEENQGVFKRM